MVTSSLHSSRESPRMGFWFSTLDWPQKAKLLRWESTSPKSATSTLLPLIFKVVLQLVELMERSDFIKKTLKMQVLSFLASLTQSFTWKWPKTANGYWPPLYTTCCLSLLFRRMAKTDLNQECKVKNLLLSNLLCYQKILQPITFKTSDSNLHISTQARKLLSYRLLETTLSPGVWST